ncbi:hypothetical protein HMPREF1868_00100 [Olsenella sp. DNF00959]|nr:hypothetical protein HMPREF1868_00100 [Olsenella sp. DNF00959]
MLPFESALAQSGLAPVTKRRAVMLYSVVFGQQEFNWGNVSKATGLSRRSSFELIKKLKETGLVNSADGRGRGAYRFVPARKPFES